MYVYSVPVGYRAIVISSKKDRIKILSFIAKGNIEI